MSFPGKLPGFFFLLGRQNVKHETEGHLLRWFMRLKPFFTEQSPLQDIYISNHSLFHEFGIERWVSERANGRASGPVLTSRFLAVLNHCRAVRMHLNSSYDRSREFGNCLVALMTPCDNDRDSTIQFVKNWSNWNIEGNKPADKFKTTAYQSPKHRLTIGQKNPGAESMKLICDHRIEWSMTKPALKHKVSQR